MNIVIDLSQFYQFLNLPPDEMLIRFFLNVGWLPISIALLWGFWQMWVFYLNEKWGAKQKFVLLAIDIPKGNEQSPKAVENLFAYLAGAHSTLNLVDLYWEGKYQLSFSFEIVSIEGYTQFLIRTPESFRSLVDSAIYSQYPDAEITEVDDYTTSLPSKFPDDEYDIWGAEFIQNKNGAYPIKTYKEFEHQMGKPELHFRDPMASLMDLCSTLKAGEQLWYQIIVIPTDFEWPIIGEKEISKILKEKPKSKVSIVNKFLDSIVKLIDEATGMSFAPAEAKKEDDSLKMMNLKPQEKKQIEAIQDKISKLGFKFKIRVVYVAKKDVKNNPKVVNGFVGFMKQYAFNDLNNLKPDMKITATSTSYLFKESRLLERKNKIMRYYKSRSGNGRAPGLMNVEELATIWHFPIESVVRAPLIQKTSGKKAEPPMSLPIGESSINIGNNDSIFNQISASELFDKPSKAQTETKKPSDSEKPDIFKDNEKDDNDAPPDNLPFV